MFNLVDKDKNGFISFREFCDLFVIFKNGLVQQNMHFLFIILMVCRNRRGKGRFAI